MSLSLDDTIVALATAPGKSAIAIVRMSGRMSTDIASKFLVAESHISISDLAPRVVANATVASAEHVIDQCLIVRFEAPRSYTGEDCIEIHVHGNPLIIDHVLDLAVSHGARHAEPGEFSRRAFVNGKIDLTQAEAIADLIEAESDAALYLSQRQLRGELQRKLASYKEALVSILARIELELDFIEEGYEFQSADEVKQVLTEFLSFTKDLIFTHKNGVHLRHGPQILLCGAPNAGKSSLFNAMVGFSRAIVSSTPGTTRDYLEENISYGGMPFRLVDTAGLRLTADDIEAQGVQIARDLIPTADHVLYLIDATSATISEEEAIANSLAKEFPRTKFTIQYTKADLVGEYSLNGSAASSILDRSSIVAILDRLVATYSVDVSTGIALLNERHVRLLREILDQLETILCVPIESTEILSAQLRSLLRPLSELTGETTNQDILDSIFSAFCIGK